MARPACSFIFNRTVHLVLTRRGDVCSVIARLLSCAGRLLASLKPLRAFSRVIAPNVPPTSLEHIRAGPFYTLAEINADFSSTRDASCWKSLEIKKTLKSEKVWNYFEARNFIDLRQWSLESYKNKGTFDVWSEERSFERSKFFENIV